MRHGSGVSLAANLDVDGPNTSVPTGSDSCNPTCWPRGPRQLWVKDQNGLPYFEILNFPLPLSSGL